MTETATAQVTVEAFIEAIEAKFDTLEFPMTFSVMKGRKYDRIVRESGQRSVFAFMDKSGNLYKASGWSAPAAGVRYSADEVMTKGVAAADPHGGFLYY